ncbi:MAG: alpha/beta fold hydrolase [Proteobacteria bacterium]|nr:alpha/beta fold hydrolase [Pseudomonadota bacterium]
MPVPDERKAHAAASDLSAFRPRTWLRNPHAQSVLASSALRRWVFWRRIARIERDAREHLLDCGDGVRLQGFHTRQTTLPQPRALVVLLHGWEGSAKSTYVLNTGARLLDVGCDVFRLNLRDHGDTHHLNRDPFHSCRIDEVVGAVKAVARLFPERPLIVGGYSLGGNFALRVALRASKVGLRLAWAFAVCPPIDPSEAMRAIESSRAYSWYFLRKWRSSLRRKQKLFPQTELFAPAQLDGTLRDVTADLVARHTHFDNVENYFRGYSIAGATLAALDVPATILTAADDPIIPIADFHALHLAPTTELVVASHGGHCGFIRDAGLGSWAEDFLVDRLHAHLCNRD